MADPIARTFGSVGEAFSRAEVMVKHARVPIRPLVYARRAWGVGWLYGVLIQEDAKAWARSRPPRER